MQDEWYIKVIDGERFVYHRFTFDPEIQEHIFIGDEFIGMDHVEGDDLHMLVNGSKPLVGPGLSDRTLPVPVYSPHYQLR